MFGSKRSERIIIHFDSCCQFGMSATGGSGQNQKKNVVNTNKQMSFSNTIVEFTRLHQSLCFSTSNNNNGAEEVGKHND